MFITSGAKFGSTYLAYPGDPFRYHAHYKVHIVDWENTMEPLELVSIGRVGNIVRKTALLASVDPSTDEVRFISINWFNQ